MCVCTVSVLLPVAARGCVAVALISRSNPLPSVLILTRDANLVCVNLGEGTQSLVASHVGSFWCVTDAVWGGDGTREAVYALVGNGVLVNVCVLCVCVSLCV